ncbi:cyclic nucleotide-binding domain-containing protein [Pseudomonadota bacterium]
MSLKQELEQLSKAVLDALMACGRTAVYQAGEWLPDAASGFVGVRFIEDGEVSVFAVHHAKRIELSRCGKDEFLGVRSMLSPDSPPSIIWLAESEVTCLEFKQDDVMPMMQHPDGFALRQILERAARERDYGVLMALHPLFRALPRDERKKLLKIAHPIALLPNEPLMQHKTENDMLYLISRGRVQVTKDGLFLAEQEMGDVIGEISVLDEKATSTADVVARGWCEVLTFPGSLVRELCDQNPDFRRELDRLRETRG